MCAISLRMRVCAYNPHTHTHSTQITETGYQTYHRQHHHHRLYIYITSPSRAPVTPLTVLKRVDNNDVELHC